MPVKTLISGSDGLDADVVNEDEHNALVVATRPLKSFENDIQFFLNPTNGPNLNVNGEFTGTPDKIHDGTDSVLWTASAITGTWTFDSTDQNHTTAGNKSVDGSTVGKDGDTAQFAKGSSVNLSGYTALTGWIYLTVWKIDPTKHIEVYGWDTGTGTIVGISVNIDDYINTDELNVWQHFVIPFIDLELTSLSIDSIRVLRVSRDPRFYLDDIQLEQAGSPVIYTIEPRKGTWLHASSMRITLVDAYAATLADSTVPKIPHNTLLGVAALSTGLLYQDWRGEGIKTSYVIRQLIDLLQFPGTKIVNTGTDGTNTWITLDLIFAEPGILKAEENDKVTVSVRDDLSGLIFTRISLGGREEERKLC